MRNYIKSLGYYALTILDSLINFLASAVGVYPRVDTASSFLIFLELRKVGAVLGGTAKRRGDLESKADRQMEEAKDTLDGQNL